MLIIGMLSKQTDGTLCVIDIELWHVEIVDEINQLLFARWSKLFASNLLEELFELHLQVTGISVVGEVYQLKVEVVRMFLHDCTQCSFGQCSLTTTGQSDQ